MTDLAELRQKGHRLQERNGRSRSVNGDGSLRPTKAVKNKKANLTRLDEDNAFGSYGLTGRQYAFVVEYLTDPTSQADAARRAGYSPKTAASAASSLLRRADVKASIEDMRERMFGNTEAVVEMMINRLREIAMDSRPEPKSADQIKAIEKWLMYHGIGLQTDDSAGRVELVVTWADGTPQDMREKFSDIEDAEWEDVTDG